MSSGDSDWYGADIGTVCYLLDRIADALEADHELAKSQHERNEARVTEYQAKHPDDDKEQQRHNDLWERQIKVNEDRLEADKLHNEMHMRGTAHGERN